MLAFAYSPIPAEAINTSQFFSTITILELVAHTKDGNIREHKASAGKSISIM